jgi:hypothetical protein
LTSVISTGAAVVAVGASVVVVDPVVEVVVVVVVVVAESVVMGSTVVVTSPGTVVVASLVTEVDSDVVSSSPPHATPKEPSPKTVAAIRAAHLRVDLTNMMHLLEHESLRLELPDQNWPECQYRGSSVYLVVLVQER